MNEPLDCAYLREWIGREEIVTDHLSATLVDRFRATIGLPVGPADKSAAAPRLIHFCLCQPAAAMDALGEDGHPARGGFLPPVPLPRRMWAGSEIAFRGDLRVGETVTRRSTVADLVVKEGRTGTLCFVTVDHDISGDAGGRVLDRQTIVYRTPETAGGAARMPEPAATGHFRTAVHPSPAFLFRYSALTFNGHRIHYDRPYATDVEGYGGLVVHGPLQATLLYHLAALRNEGPPPDEFGFRSTSSLVDTEEFALHAGLLIDGRMTLWTARPGGPTAMRAEARWS